VGCLEGWMWMDVDELGGLIFGGGCCGCGCGYEVKWEGKGMFWKGRMWVMIPGDGR